MPAGPKKLLMLSLVAIGLLMVPNHAFADKTLATPNNYYGKEILKALAYLKTLAIGDNVKDKDTALSVYNILIKRFRDGKIFVDSFNESGVDGKNYIIKRDELIIEKNLFRGNPKSPQLTLDASKASHLGLLIGIISTLYHELHHSIYDNLGDRSSSKLTECLGLGSEVEYFAHLATINFLARLMEKKFKQYEEIKKKRGFAFVPKRLRLLQEFKALASAVSTGFTDLNDNKYGPPIGEDAIAEIKKTLDVANEEIKFLQHLVDLRNRLKAGLKKAQSGKKNGKTKPSGQTKPKDKNAAFDQNEEAGYRSIVDPGFFDNLDVTLLAATGEPISIVCPRPQETTGETDSVGIPEGFNVAIETPEACVGTTYVVGKGTGYPGQMPKVGQLLQHDGETPVVMVPTENTPVVSTPRQEPRITSTPSKQPSVTSSPDNEGAPQETPVSSPPSKDKPSDKPGDTTIDLGLVKAQESVVKLALSDKSTGKPVGDAVVKLLSDEPPLPDEAGSEHASLIDSGFVEDANGGTSDNDGNIDLAALTFPVGDTKPSPGGKKKQPAPKAKTKKPIDEMNLQELADELGRIQDTTTGFERIRETLKKKDPGFAKDLQDNENKMQTALDKKREEFRNTQIGTPYKKMQEAYRNIRDKYEAKERDIENKHLKNQPKKFAKAYWAARQRHDTERAKIAYIIKRLREWDPELMKKVLKDLRKKRAAKKAAQRAVERTIKDIIDAIEEGAKAATDAAKGIEDPLRKALKDIQRAYGPIGNDQPSRIRKASDGRNRTFALAIDAESKKQFVVALNKDLAAPDDVLVSAMLNPLLMGRVVDAFIIGGQAYLVVRSREAAADTLAARLGSEKWVSWFEPDPCRQKENLHNQPPGG